MPGQRSVGPFCSMVVDTMLGNGNSLAALNANQLGEGAEVFCKENKGVYRLKFFAVVQSTPTYVTASNGFTWCLTEPEFWFTNSAIPGVGFSIASQNPASNTWTAMRTGTNFYQGNSTFNGSFWSVDTTTGVMTLNANAGPFRAYQIAMTFSLFSSSAVDVELNYTTQGVDLNPPYNTAAIPGSVTVTPNASGVVTATFISQIAGSAGLYFQPIWRRTGSQTVAFTVVRMSMTPIGAKYA